MKALFVSPEHRRLTLYRTHPAYRSIFFVIVIWLSSQITIAVLFSHRKTEALSLSDRYKKAEAEVKRIVPEEEALGPLAKKIQLANTWAPSLSQRTWIGDLLSRIDRSIPPEVCLTEISIHNRFPNLKAPDHIAIEINGAAKSQGAATWLSALQTLFPTWRVIPVRTGEANAPGDPAVDLADNLSAFSILLQQPSATSQK